MNKRCYKITFIMLLFLNVHGTTFLATTIYNAIHRCDLPHELRHGIHHLFFFKNHFSNGEPGSRETNLQQASSDEHQPTTAVNPTKSVNDTES